MKNVLCVLGLVVLLSACAPSGKSSFPLLESGSSGSGDNQANNQPPPADTGGGSTTTPVDTHAGDHVVIPPFDSLPDGPLKFSHPWLNTETSIVIDAYQGNSIDWKKMAADPRVAGVIHRSSIGLQADSQYASRRKIAKDSGYFWGAYHLGRSGDPIAQAKFFLNTTGNDPETLLFLDLEDTSSSSMMNIPNALKFMEYVYQATGRVPVVYANNSVTKALNAAMAGNALFEKSRLWYARFVQDIQSFPKGIWSTYFLWQFSSEINCGKTGACLYNVPGTKADMDINVFYGSKAALASQWK